MSAQTPVFTGHVDENGKLSFDTRWIYEAYIKKLKGQAVEIVVRPQRKQRSLDQNRYWHAVPVRMIALETGEDPDAVHYALLGACWGWRHSDALGREIPVKGSSRKLTVDEFSHMIEWVGPWAMERLGLQIPLPNECDWGDAA